MDKVCSPDNLRAAFAKVKVNRGSAGIDHMTIEMFDARLEDHLGRLAELLRAGTYRPQAIERVWIPKPGTKEKRPLGIPTVRDRVVQAALRNVLEPIFEKDFAATSYGFRPGRGCKDALRQVDALLRQGYTFVVDATCPDGFDFLGCHFERGKHWPRSKSLKKLKDSIRAKTRRNHGSSLCAIILDINQTLHGWFGYFQHSPRSTFVRLDGWTRMRLRSILRKRRGGQGRGVRG